MNDATKPLVASADRTVSGLEFLRKIAAGEYANVPIGDHTGNVEPGAMVEVQLLEGVT